MSMSSWAMSRETSSENFCIALWKKERKQRFLEQFNYLFVDECFAIYTE